MKPIREMISKLPCNFERIRFTKLVAGKTLKKHTDNIDDGIKNKKIVRLHIPIRTNNDVIFTFYENENDARFRGRIAFASFFPSVFFVVEDLSSLVERE